MKQFYIQFYRELSLFTNFTKFKLAKNKINLISFLFLVVTFALILFNLIIIDSMDISYQFVFLTKDFYLFYKIIEIWVIFLDDYKFLESNIDEKEHIFLKNLKRKSYLELGGLIQINLHILILYFIGDGIHFYLNVIVIYSIVFLTFKICSYYKKHKEICNYYNNLDKFLEKVEEGDMECVICTEKMKIARKLNCSHNFHLICLNKWFENGHNSCPICRREINFDKELEKSIRNRVETNNTNGNRNRIFSLSLSSRFFSWLPNFSLRIIRLYNNPN